MTILLYYAIFYFMQMLLSQLNPLYSDTKPPIILSMYEGLLSYQSLIHFENECGFGFQDEYRFVLTSRNRIHPRVKPVFILKANPHSSKNPFCIHPKTPFCIHPKSRPAFI